MTDPPRRSWKISVRTEGAADVWSIKRMFLIDTDILIYALKGKDPVESRIEKEISSPCAISIITYGEL